MNTEFKKIYIFEVILFLFITIYSSLIINLSMNVRNIVLIIFLVAFYALSLYLLGYKKFKSFDRWSAIKIILATFIGAMCVLFMLGLLTGFSTTMFSYKIDAMLSGIIPLASIITLEELIRYVLFSYNKEKKHLIIVTILFILLNIISVANKDLLISKVQWFAFITLTIFPVISQELLCSYMTNNFGFIPSLLFKSLAKLYIYILAVFPNLTDYLTGVIDILLPYVIYLEQRKQEK